MKKYINHIKSIKNTNKFSTHLLRNFLMMAILPILVTTLISFGICYNAILANSIAASHEITDYAANEINRVQNIAEDIVQSMETSSEIQISMRYTYYNTITQLIAPFHINTSLSLLQQSASTEIVDIYCLNRNGLIYHSTTTSNINNLFVGKSWYQQIITSEEPIWFEPYDTSFITGYDYNTLISYGVANYDYITNEPNGVILIEFNADTIFNNLSNTDAINSNTYYVLNEDNEVLFTTDSNGMEITDSNMYFESLSHSNYYYSNTLDNNWKVVGVISASDIASSALSQLFIAMIILLALAITLAVVISIRRAKQISEPLHTLINQMETTQGETNNAALLIPSSTDEIIALYESFNIMINNSNHYIEEIKKEQTNLRIANFKALQAQINPHFLYNTMDTIAWNIRLNENEKAVNSIMALTKFFRSSLHKGEDIIFLNQEFEQVSLYLEIQLYRYGDMLDYSIDLDPDLQSYTIPKLSLQPIVENAIYHGIKNKDDYGHISVSTKRYNDYYTILIHDNGLGMTLERLDEVNNALFNNLPINTNESGGYGVHNVNERIQIHFGPEYGLKYYSVLGEYTEVVLKLPYIDK